MRVLFRTHRSRFTPWALFALLVLTLPVGVATAADAPLPEAAEDSAPTLAEMEAQLFVPEAVEASSCPSGTFLHECEVTDACGRTFTDSTCCPNFTVGFCVIAGNAQMPGCYFGVFADCLGF